MGHRTGKDHLQFAPLATPLHELIAQDNIVRFINAFVDNIDLGKLVFTQVAAYKLGAPAYPRVLVKIYITGHLTIRDNKAAK